MEQVMLLQLQDRYGVFHSSLPHNDGTPLVWQNNRWCWEDWKDTFNLQSSWKDTIYATPPSKLSSLW
jgi:hypothetical protein